MMTKVVPCLLTVCALAGSVQAALFVGPNSNVDAPVVADGGLVFKVTSPISVTALSAFASGGSFSGAVSVRILDYNNTSLAQATVTPSSSIVGLVWATETLGTPITLNPGTYAITGVGFASSIDFGSGVHATYSGLGAVSAYDSYYGVDGTGTDGVVFSGAGSAALPQPSASWLALGDPKMRVVNFDFTPVPEPSVYALVGGLGLIGFGLWKRAAQR
ncbi:MAG TPA: PEP-CTERM sorting domain-containing protein [Candidatus Limnocylindria bacterium]|nr:PEP-CTERM sorting domain-containing protein [Candidatus Limnocylindria bacterium]